MSTPTVVLEAARERARAQHESAYADYVDEKKRYSALLATRREEAHLLGGERKLARYGDTFLQEIAKPAPE